MHYKNNIMYCEKSSSLLLPYAYYKTSVKPFFVYMVIFIERIFAGKSLYLRPPYKLSIRSSLQLHCVLSQEHVNLRGLRQLAADIHWWCGPASVSQEVLAAPTRDVCLFSQMLLPLHHFYSNKVPLRPIRNY